MTKQHFEFVASLINAANKGVAPQHLAILAAAKFTNESYIHMDVGYATSAPGIMVGTFDSSGNLSDNHVTLEFPSSSAITAGEEYLVTIIG